MKKIPLFLSLFFSLALLSQTQLKVMSYNLLDFPKLLPNPRENYLKSILDAIQPDIFMVCELQTEAGADLILNTSLQTTDNRYARAAFIGNQSSSYQGIQQLVFYNSHKLLLTAQSEVVTSIRDINHYTFKLKTVNMATNPLFLEVFVAHLKSSQGYESQRASMVQDFTSALGSIPSNHFVLIGGDFNLYTNTELAYQELLDNTNAVVLVDPINHPGSWHNNSIFTDIHTQSTHTSSFYFDGSNNYGAGGGLDDRFDFILMSKNLQTSSDLYYVTDSYLAYGNNANCFNKSINDTSCSGTFSQTIRDNLYNMSDHLPVVMTLETPESTLAVKNQNLVAPVVFRRGNLIKDWLELQLNTNIEVANLKVYNQIGQVVLNKFITTSKTLKYNIKHLKPGVYYIKIDNLKSVKPLKFIKLP
ncbi:MAG: T9SS type A sorting domain-containing protein [Flavobacteriaceae bacterium]|nr:T9SS type A sorting domain-containing protein [Flavobacteriaceae bacterium]